MRWIQEMVDKLTCAQNGEKAKVIEAYMYLTGKSSQQLYRIAKKNGYRSGRKKRRDAGACELNETQVEFIASQIHVTTRELKGPITPVAKALRDAEKNNIIEPGTISESRLQAILRERNINAAALKAPEPHIRMRSLHPNHVHVFDASVCIQYYLKGKNGKKGLRMMREDLFYKNKWQNFAVVNDKLHRYVLVDHFSGAIWVKYYYTGGETQENLYDFLLSGWDFKDERFPFRGVPRYMLWDAGAANTAAAIKEFVKRLGIKTPDALPHNPKRQGAAEVTQNIVERWFESGLRMEPAHTVEQLNEWALDWCIWFNASRIHTRHKMTRTDCWLKYVRQEHIRDLPDREMLQYLFARPGEERTVKGDYTITYHYKRSGSRTYNLKHVEGVIPNRTKVMVILRPFSWPEIGVVVNDTEHLVPPVGTVEGSFSADAAVIGEEFKRMPETPAQRMKKRAENLAYGKNRKKDDVPFEGLRMFGHHAEDVQHTYMPRVGTPLEIRKPAAGDPVKVIPLMVFFKQLIQAGVRLTPALNAELRAELGTSVPADRADAIVRALVEGESWQPEGPAAQAL